MSATVESPVVPGPIQGPTREEPLIEALLLDDYPSLVHLAYLILPPSISRAQRVAAAHAVVQRALPPGLTLPVGHGREHMRGRVVREATRHASQRSALDRLGSVLARADSLSFEPCSTKVDRVAIRQRCARGRRTAIACTLIVALGIGVSLLLS
ncbi:hypothetical protein AB0L70_28700 [Kribbella sp. NPDC051952]|uniref:hypothetical protein n=1 Tax=Kribbella sp. NPDC051952 TaxID=3154851 RepID=UPI003444E7F9